MLQQLVDRGQEQRASVAVAGPMVGRQRRLHGGTYPDSAVDGAHPLRWPPESDEGHLRRVDDTEYGIDA